MQIKTAKFIMGIRPGQEFSPHKTYAQFAAIGRSNVGKSTFINNFTGFKDLCHSGRTPGVTQQANIFALNQRIYFTDLPGYGYAKLSKQQRNALGELIFWYLGSSGVKFKAVFLLLDALIGPTAQDLDMANFLNENEIPMVVIANKIDKLKANQRQKALQNIQISFSDHKIIPYSSKTGEGKKEVLQLLD